MEAPPVTVMPVTGGTINMMEYLLQGKICTYLFTQKETFFKIVHFKAQKWTI